MTEARNIRIKTSTAEGTVGCSTLQLTIEGTLIAEGTGEVLRGAGAPLVNNGLLEAIGGDLQVHQNQVPMVDGACALNAGDIEFTGAITNTNSTLLLRATNGICRLSGGTIIGGTIDIDEELVIHGGAFRYVHVVRSENANAQLRVNPSDGTLDGIPLDADMYLDQGAQVTVLNDLIVNGRVILNRIINHTSTQFDVGSNFSGGEQTLGGTGEVHFVGALGDTGDRWVRPTDGGSLTIGSNVTIKISTVDGAVGSSSRPLMVEGTLVADGGRKILRVLGVTNVDVGGDFNAAPGGVSDVNSSMTHAGGSFMTLQIAGVVAHEFGRIDIQATVNLGGTLSVSPVGEFTPTSGQSFEVITFGSRTGDFDMKTGLTIGRITLDPQYDAESLTLVAL